MSAVDSGHTAPPSARWAAIEQLFTRALDLPSGERDQFLAAACPDDDALRREVRNLLTAHDAVATQGSTRERFLERLDAERAAALIEPTTATNLPERLQSALSSTYHVERELGGGGMSRIFAAEERSLGRKVVVKVLPPELSSAISVDRFRREVTFVARLQHPHIVPLLIAGEADGLLYYTMPFVEGESIRQRLSRSGSLPAADVVRILRHVADALACAHARGVVHRDIKPGNVLLSRGHALVADFGVAKALDAAATVERTPVTGADVFIGTPAHTDVAQLVGTPAYMAPEQLIADPAADHRADIYALGILGYEMLTGAHPFVGRSIRAVIAAHLAETPEPIARRRPDVPNALATLIARCLEKDPARRPQTAEDVLRELERLAAARSPAPLERQRRVARRRVAALIGALAAVAAIAGYTRRPERAADGRAAIQSVAVLPFANMSADRENEYFADGITEELINALTKVQGLRVPARTSSFAFKGKNLSIRVIAESLQVGAVLEGSVRRAGNQLKVAAQLINAADGYHLWSETYERDLEDVFAVQDEIAGAIVGALARRLTGTEGGAARRSAPVPSRRIDPVVYARYLGGLAAWHQDRRGALEAFEAVSRQEPAFAPVFARLAYAYGERAFGQPAERRKYLARGREAAMRAIRLDPKLADGRAALGHLLMQDYDWDAAARELARAIALDPSHVDARLSHSDYLMYVGRVDDAVDEAMVAYQLDPLSLRTRFQVAVTLYAAHRFDEARDQFLGLLASNPENHRPEVWVACTYLRQHRAREGLEWMHRAAANDTRTAIRGHVAYGFAAVGQNDAALGLLRQIETAPPPEQPAYILGIAYGYVGNMDRAFYWMNRAIDRHEVHALWLKVEPAFDPMRHDPRFDALLRRVNLM